MKANEKFLLRFLEGTDKSFVIPVYQRNYDWKKEQCKQLFDDLCDIIKNNFRTHFFGSIVCISDEDSDNQQYIIIDGQQRLTTVSLTLLALYNLIDSGEVTDNNNILEKIRNEYLVDKYKPTDKKIKLKLTKEDKNAFDRLFDNEEKYFIQGCNVTTNYLYFIEWIKNSPYEVNDFFEAIKRLMIVEIKLKNSEDDPQLIFESLNSTGLELKEADKIRNYVLMGKDLGTQNKFYNEYWTKIEKLTNNKVDDFVRDYLTMKENRIPNIKRIYIEFKRYMINKNICTEMVLRDMLTYAQYYDIILNQTFNNIEINKSLKRLNRLETTVMYPYLLEVFHRKHAGQIETSEVLDILLLLEGYIFRRILCGVQTNALNKVFMNLEKEIAKYDEATSNYVDVVKYVLKMKQSTQRFPNDEELKTKIIDKDIYNMKHTIFLLERIENYNNVERVDIQGMIDEKKLSIEHIMPQELTQSWQKALGFEYESIHTRLLHTLGNLTLTGYNQKYSNKPFVEKRDMKDGFRESRLFLNKYISELDEWNDEKIIERTMHLYNKMTQIWPDIQTSFKPQKVLDNYYTLDDEESFTNRSINSFEFIGIEYKAKTWTDFYEKILDMLYELDKVTFMRAVKESVSDQYIVKKFSGVKEDVRDGYKVAEGLYVEKNLNTDSKLTVLRYLIKFYDLQLTDVGFYLGAQA